MFNLIRSWSTNLIALHTLKNAAAGIAALALLAGVPAALATPVVQYTGTLAQAAITGINGIEVGGQTYDVKFVGPAESCAAVFGSCTPASFLPSGLSASAAAAALVSAWTSDANILHGFDEMGATLLFNSFVGMQNDLQGIPHLVRLGPAIDLPTDVNCLHGGLTAAICGDLAELYLGPVAAQSSYSLYDPLSGHGGFGTLQSNPPTDALGGNTAVWTLEAMGGGSVPEPGSAALVALAGAALGLARRRKARQA